jgi:hypothetical protein
MGTIMEIGRRDKIIGIDENPINHIEKPKKVKRKRLR